MSDTDDKYTIPLNALQWVLTHRLQHSRTWNEMEITTSEKKFTIRWFSPKKGNESFMERVLPMRIDTLNGEIFRQFTKLQEEKKGAGHV